MFTPLSVQLATAKTDEYIELNIHPLYKQNYIRFIQVIRAMTISETSVEEHERITTFLQPRSQS